MRQIQQDDKKSMWPQLFFTSLIVLGVGMTGASMIKRVQAIENYPRIVVDILQQSCDTSAFANPMENVRSETTQMIDRPCQDFTTAPALVKSEFRDRNGSGIVISRPGLDLKDIR